MARSGAAAAGWVVELRAESLAEDSAMMRRLNVTTRSQGDATPACSLGPADRFTSNQYRDKGVAQPTSSSRDCGTLIRESCGS